MPAHRLSTAQRISRTAYSVRSFFTPRATMTTDGERVPLGRPQHRASAQGAAAREHDGINRRTALAAVGVAGGGWTLSAMLSPAEAAVRVPGNPAPALPGGMTPLLEVFANWSGETRTAPLWTVAPTTADQVVELARWASANDWRLRARGYQHNWSPLSVESGATQESRVLMVDTLKHLNAISVDATANTVTAQGGASLEAVLNAASKSGLGIMHHPAPGDITIGGALAIGGHGTAVPASNETRPAGATYGSLSNLVVSMEAVVWDEAAGDYAVRRFERTDPDIAPLLTHLGRTIVTSVQLRLAQLGNMRCRSYVTVPTWELFAKPGSWGRTVDSYLRSCGRVEVILFPFTSFPWLKTWQFSQYKPLLSRWTSSPYNYVFSDNIPQQISDLFKQIQTGTPSTVTKLGPAQQRITATSLVSSFVADLWGAPKNLQLYVRPNTLKVTANGYAIHCRRADVQRVLYEFHNYYKTSVNNFAKRWRFPVNGPLEIRVTGVDNPADVEVPGAVTPTLSPSRPFADHPEWDTVVWLDILTFPGTPYSLQFFQECEQWIINNYASYAGVRMEWSKGWGYSAEGAWQNQDILRQQVPRSYNQGQPADQGWDSAVRTLERLDPARIYSAPLHDRLMPPSGG